MNISENQEIKINVSIPGENTQKIVDTESRYLATSTKTSPVAVKTAKGMWAEDMDGNIILDFTNGMVGGTGHCHPKVVQAIKKQADEFLFFNGPDFYYEIQAKLAQKLTEIVPGNFNKKVFLCSSGAEANEAAIKISRHSTDRKRFIAFLGAFHGRTIGALSLTASKAVHQGKFFPTMQGVTHIPYAYCYRCAYQMKYPDCDIWCAKILEKLYFHSNLPPDEVAAIFFEPIQGEGGYVVPPKEFFKELKRIANEHGILMVDDEVQAGFGRTGKMFAIEHFDIIPDIVSLAKAMGSGLPIGASVFNAKYDFSVQGAHSNTYGGSPIPAAAALATIDAIYEDKMIQNAENTGNYFISKLKELQETYPVIGDVRGIALMCAIEFVKDRKTKEFAKDFREKVITLCYQKGLLLLPCGISGIRFTPGLIVNKNEIDIAVKILKESIEKALV